MDHGWVMQVTTNVSNYAGRLAAATTMDLYISSLVDFFSCIEKFLVSQSKISSPMGQLFYFKLVLLIWGVGGSYIQV